MRGQPHIRISLLRFPQEGYQSNFIDFHKFSTDYMPVATNQKFYFYSCPAVCNRSMLEANNLWGRSNTAAILAPWPIPLIPIDLITLITLEWSTNKSWRATLLNFLQFSVPSPSLVSITSLSTQLLNTLGLCSSFTLRRRIPVSLLNISGYCNQSIKQYIQQE